MGIIVGCGLIKGVIMLKFKFNYLNNTLAIHQEGNIWHQIVEENQFQGNFGSQGFKLENGWITCTVYEKKIRVFSKQTKDEQPTDFWIPEKVIYYRKDLPKECPIIFTFTAADQVEKINGKWTKKGGQT